MRKKVDYFSIWLGITILGLSILVLFALIKLQPDFFRDLTFIL